MSGQTLGHPWNDYITDRFEQADRHSRPRYVVRRLDLRSPAASGTHEYDLAFGHLNEESTSGSRELLREPAWWSYIQTRLAELYARSGLERYPRLETLNGAWAVARSVLGSTTRTPSVIPGEEQSVELVWNRNDWHIELEISETSPYVWAKNLVTGEIVSGDLEERRETLRDLLAEISAS